MPMTLPRKFAGASSNRCRSTRQCALREISVASVRPELPRLSMDQSYHSKNRAIKNSGTWIGSSSACGFHAAVGRPHSFTVTVRLRSFVCSLLILHQFRAPYSFTVIFRLFLFIEFWRGEGCGVGYKPGTFLTLRTDIVLAAHD